MRQALLAVKRVGLCVSRVLRGRFCGILNVALSDDVGACGRGGMAEWFKAAVLKTVEPQGSVGSNPTSSASIRSGRANARPVLLGVHAAEDKMRRCRVSTPYP